jgi:hypothetical protein
MTQRYHIQNDGSHFHTGHMKNGDQVLMGVLLPELVCVEFDAQGNLREVVTREIARQFLPMRNGIYRAENWILKALLQQWQEELEITSGTICVKPFEIPERGIGIRDLPDHYQEIVNGSTQYLDEEELRAAQEDIRAWLEHGDFVLCWAEEYYMDHDGELVAT